MTDKLKESLSALIDGEASEIEVHRLLRELGTNQSLKPSWQAWMQARAVLQGENRLPAARHAELHERISLAIAEEETWTSDNKRIALPRAFTRPMAGMAVAASLVVAVMLGVYMQQPGNPEAAVSTQTASRAPSQVINAQPVALGQTMPPVQQSVVRQNPVDDGQQQDLRELNAEQQAELRAYLNAHDRMARMNPNARMVIFENPNTNP